MRAPQTRLEGSQFDLRVERACGLQSSRFFHGQHQALPKILGRDMELVVIQFLRWIPHYRLQ